MTTLIISYFIYEFLLDSPLTKLFLENKFSWTTSNKNKLIHSFETSSEFHSHFHNILRLFGVLPNFLFTKSETMHDNYL